MPSNTHGADLNEIGLGYFLAGEKWFSKEAEAHFKQKVKLVSHAELQMQLGRAKAMAVEVMKYIKQHYKNTKITNVFWTARPGTLAKATGDKTVDQKENPTDILVRLGSGDFLGISAKSSQHSPEIGFKNPGLGTIEKDLKINLSKIVKESMDPMVKYYKLPASLEARKTYLRTHPTIQAVTHSLGEQILQDVRGEFLQELKSLSENALREYIMKAWLNSSKKLFPPYIKVTGVGIKIPFTAHVTNPLKNPKLDALSRGKLQLTEVGRAAVGVTAGGVRILKMRVKWASEYFASPLKFSGDPWT